MATLPPEIIARVKDETDIVDLVGRYVRLQAAGAGYKGLCPFHQEKSPSFHVTPARSGYKCFGCGEGGDAISFLMAVENLTFPEAMETLARSLDIDLAKYLQPGEDEGEKRAFFRANEVACEIMREAWHDPGLGTTAREYMVERGFNLETLDRYDVGWAPSGSWMLGQLQKHGVTEDLALAAGLVRRRDDGSVFAYFRERVMFPIRNIARQVTGFGGRIIGQGEPKYLNSADSPNFSKGRLLYGFDTARMVIARAKVAVLVEGYLDLIAMAQVGVANVVATCGTAFTPDQARLLRRGAKEVIVLFDGDKAGRKAAVRSCHVSLAAGLEAKIASLPKGLDPADLVIQQGPEALNEVIEGAIPYLRYVREAVTQAGDDRAQLEKGVHQVLTTIAEVPDPIRQQYMLREAADLFGLEAAVLAEALKKEKMRPVRRPTEPEADEGPEMAGEAPTPVRKVPFRTLTAVRSERVEAELLAYALRDDTGGAARQLVDGGANIEFSPLAAILFGEITAWHQAGCDQTPGQYVEQRWHDHEGGYRAFVTDLLERDIPDGGETERAVRESMERLRQARRMQHG